MKLSPDKGLLDRLFSIYIRLRDTDENGQGYCITCGERFGYRQLSCGHFVKRRHDILRWDTKNAYAQCFPCNIKDDDKLYRERLIQLKGERLVDELDQLKNQTAKWQDWHVANMIKVNRLRCRELLKEKNFKITIP